LLMAAIGDLQMLQLHPNEQQHHQHWCHQYWSQGGSYSNNFSWRASGKLARSYSACSCIQLRLRQGLQTEVCAPFGLTACCLRCIALVKRDTFLRRCLTTPHLHQVFKQCDVVIVQQQLHLVHSSDARTSQWASLCVAARSRGRQ
jgi:hypothetical protein